MSNTFADLLVTDQSVNQDDQIDDQGDVGSGELEGDIEDGDEVGSVGDVDGEEGEGEEEEGGEDPDGGSEPFQLIVPLTRSDGTVEEVTVAEDEIEEMVAKAKNFDTVYQHAAALSTQLEQTKHLATAVAQHPVMSRLFQMYIQGYPEQQILAYHQEIINTMIPQNQPQTDPNLEMLDEPQRVLFRQMQEQLQAERTRREQLEQRFAQADAERDVSAATSHNTKLFEKEISASGYEFSSSDADLAKIRDAMTSLYPGLDYSRTRFTETQVRAILQSAGLQRRRGKVSQQVQQATKSKSAPRVIGGTKTVGTGRRKQSQQPSSGGGMAQRREALLSLGQ